MIEQFHEKIAVQNGQQCQIPWVEDTGGERNHEKVVEGGPRDVHQNASEGYVAANGKSAEYFANVTAA